MQIIMNHNYEETLRRLRMIVVSLQNEIDYKNHQLLEMGHEHSEALACARRHIIGLTENINSKQRHLLVLECKYNEAQHKVRKLMNSDNDKLHKGCCKELQHMKNMVSDMNREMECLKKENGNLNKQLEESKALNDMQQKNFIEEIQKLRMELYNESHVESSDGDLSKLITTFRNQLKDKMEFLECVENLNSSLIVKEHQYKQEILDARQESINSLQGMFGGRSHLGIKRMGELDPKPFRDSCLQKHSSEQWQDISAMLCSSWEENMKDPAWHPFKIIKVNGILQVTMDENDERLKGLRNEYGEVVYNSVVNALMEMEEYNSSGRYAVPEIWNWKEGRKATLKEIIQYIIRQLKTHKRKRK